MFVDAIGLYPQTKVSGIFEQIGKRAIVPETGFSYGGDTPAVLWVGLAAPCTT